MFLNLTSCFILTFFQCHLVNLGVEINVKMPEVMNIKDLFTELKLRLLTHVRFFLKTGSDTFRSVLIYGKEQESRKKIFVIVQKIHLPEKVWP